MLPYNRLEYMYHNILLVNIKYASHFNHVNVLIVYFLPFYFIQYISVVVWEKPGKVVCYQGKLKITFENKQRGITKACILIQRRL